MDARSSEPGLAIPQTRQRLEPALTSAPQPLQAKANIALRVVDSHGKNTSSLRLFRVESQRRRCRFQGGFCYLSFCTGVRWRLFQAEVGVSVIARAYQLLGKRKSIRHL
jgi:hypothetical protein